MNSAPPTQPAPSYSPPENELVRFVKSDQDYETVMGRPLSLTLYLEYRVGREQFSKHFTRFNHHVRNLSPHSLFCVMHLSTEIL